jgi:hypothetical protein
MIKITELFCKFSYRFTLKKYVNLNLKFRNKNYYKKWTASWYIVTSLLLEQLKQRLIDVTSFKLLKSLYAPSVLVKRITDFGSDFPHLLDCRIDKAKFRSLVTFLFSIFYLSYHFNFSLDDQTLPVIRDCIHDVITPPVSC